MKYKWEITTLILALAVTVLSISQLFQDGNKNIEQPIEKADIVLESIMTRSSVRTYSDEKVNKEFIEKMLRAGMAAPTAGNRQPWEFYVVQDTSIIKQMTKVSKYTAPMNDEAQLAIVVCGVPSLSFPTEPTYWIQDVSAATENILLAAHGLGLGAVWCGVFPGEDRVETLRGMLDIPDHAIPFNIIMIGHPDTDPNIKDKWKPERVHYVN